MNEINKESKEIQDDFNPVIEEQMNKLDLEDIITKRKYYPCECGGDLIGIDADEDFEQIYIARFYSDGERSSLWMRLKVAWRVIMHPDDTDLSDLVLSPGTASKLGQDLIQMCVDIHERKKK